MRVACNAINAAVNESAAASMKSRIGTEIEIMIGIVNVAMDLVEAAAALAKRNWAQKSANWRRTSHVVSLAPRIGSAASVPM